MIDIKHMQEADEARREAIIDNLMTDEDLFTMAARSYANSYHHLIPNKSFLDYAVGLIESMSSAAYTRAWMNEEAA